MNLEFGPDSDTLAYTVEPAATDALIAPEVARMFGPLSERKIRKVAARHGITLLTRMGNRPALLAELSRILTKRGLLHG